MSEEFIRQLNDNYATKWNEAKAMLDTASNAKRDLTTSEKSHYDKLNADMEQLRTRVNGYKEDEQRAQAAQESFNKLLGQPKVAGHRRQADADIEQQFRDSITKRSYAPIEITDPAPRSGWQPGVEQRDLLTSTGGGLTPSSFYDTIRLHMVESSAILAAGATLLTTVTGENLSIPKTSSDSTASIVAEGAQIPESDPGLGSVTLGSYKYGFTIQVSSELANDATFDLLSHLAVQSGRAIGNGAGADFISGTGSSEPTGILSGVTLGVTGAGTSPTADELIELYSSVASPYARSKAAAWLVNNQTWGAIRKLRENGTTGAFLFDTNVPAGLGAAGTLLGRPVFIDPNVPDTGAGNKSVLFGDLSAYYVRQVDGIRFERSDDFAFDRDLITFRALLRMDGATVDTTGAVKYFVGA